jgi:hypothetical protein
MAVRATGALAAETPRFGVEEKRFEAGTCTTETCTYKSIEEEVRSTGEHKQAYNAADGHPPYGITAFEFNHTEPSAGKKMPVQNVKEIRVDLPPGLSVDPRAVPQCPMSVFREFKCPEATKVGTDQVTFVNGEGTEVTPEAFPIYNLQPEAGLPLEEGIDELGIPGLLKGGVSWHEEPGLTASLASGDYHEYFTTQVSNLSGIGLHVLRIKQTFYGNRAGSGFLRLPNNCSSTATSHIRVTSWEGESSEAFTHTPLGVEECAKPPFEPSLTVTPATTQSDQGDGLGVELELPQNEKAEQLDSSDLESSAITLPEGLTLNPAALAGLEGCTPAQIGIGTAEPARCPARSALGTVALEVPMLPPGSLTGHVYLGKPASGLITGPPYTIYINAEAPSYGQTVRLQGQVEPDLATGRLVSRFSNAPMLPFSDLELTFDGGLFAPLANPLTCGPAMSSATLVPYSAHPASYEPTIEPFTVDSNGLGGACPSPLPFAPPGLAQETAVQPALGGADTSLTLSLARSGGQQYLTQVRTVLPPGLVGLISTLAPCAEAPANAGSCTAASQIGTVSVTAGAGEAPYAFTGNVYLTEAYAGAPYGLSIVVPDVAGPFDLGTTVTRAKVTVNPTTAQVEVTTNAPGTAGAIPTIVGGVPVRIRSLRFDIDRGGFARNPTNCGELHTETRLEGTPGLPAHSGSGSSVSTLVTPFQAEGCAALPFKPVLSASTEARTSRANGASLNVAISQAGDREANIASVVTTLPAQLPSRDSTLRQACTLATFEAGPRSCPAASDVGTVSAETPLLAGKLTGPAYLVARGAEFPDLELVLEGDGVQVILDGHTHIEHGITTTTFSSDPDVPITSFALSLPTGPHSLLAANGSLCTQTTAIRKRVAVRAHGHVRRTRGRVVRRTRTVSRTTPITLSMPTTILGQNGARVVQSTTIVVHGCPALAKPITVLRHRTLGEHARITVHAPAAGRVQVTGMGLRPLTRTVRAARTVTVRLSLSRAGRRSLRTRHRLRILTLVTFTPANHSAHSRASVTLRFGAARKRRGRR